MSRMLPLTLYLPGLALRLTGLHPYEHLTTLISKAVILSASILLLWTCYAAQDDIPQSLTLAD
jgi:hypothetical protein